LLLKKFHQKNFRTASNREFPPMVARC
jgi:hypothetical protein